MACPECSGPGVKCDDCGALDVCYCNLLGHATGQCLPKMRQHPWQDFLTARRRAIRWMMENGDSADVIAAKLSMDSVQVQLIVSP